MTEISPRREAKLLTAQVLAENKEISPVLHLQCSFKRIM